MPKSDFLLWFFISVRRFLLFYYLKKSEMSHYACFSYVEKQPFADVLQNKTLQNFAIFKGKTPVLESLFNKVLALKVKTDDPIQIFSCEYCEIMKNSFFYTALVAASESCFYTIYINLSLPGKSKIPRGRFFLKILRNVPE